MESKTNKIVPFLWFNAHAGDAARYYCGIFPNARMISENPQSANFELDGQEFIAFNGGPMFQFNEASSWMIRCHDQQEVDYYWDRLVEGGTPSRCGWLKDKFGMSWQVVPIQLKALLAHPDPVKAQKAFQAMMKMQKLDIALLEAAVADEG